MTVSARIRWRDPGLWPYVQRHIPAGYTVVTDLDQATKLGHAVFAGLVPYRRDQYGLLWDAALDTGWQPSGLLPVCLAALAPVLWHGSSTVPKRFGRFCLDEGLWCRVPGKLYPPRRDGAPGERCRCYLILTPL